LAGVGIAYKDLIAFGVLILVLIFRPTGILGERSAERV
jgi:branched-chain amino acid transport system permease protein